MAAAISPAGWPSFLQGSGPATRHMLSSATGRSITGWQLRWRQHGLPTRPQAAHSTMNWSASSNSPPVSPLRAPIRALSARPAGDEAVATWGTAKNAAATGRPRSRRQSLARSQGPPLLSRVPRGFRRLADRPADPGETGRGFRATRSFVCIKFAPSKNSVPKLAHLPSGPSAGIGLGRNAKQTKTQHITHSSPHIFAAILGQLSKG